MSSHVAELPSPRKARGFSLFETRPMPFDKQLAHIRLDQPLGEHADILRGGGSDLAGCRMYAKHFGGGEGGGGATVGEKDGGDGGGGESDGGGMGRSRDTDGRGRELETLHKKDAARLAHLHAWLVERSRTQAQPPKRHNAQPSHAGSDHLRGWNEATLTRSSMAFRPPSK